LVSVMSSSSRGLDVRLHRVQRVDLLDRSSPVV
jgi:hypothetical protein